MSTFVDLTSEGDSPAGQKPRGLPFSPPCINLLSSDEEVSQKKQRLGEPCSYIKPLSGPLPDQLPSQLTFDKRPEEASSQALPPVIQPAATRQVRPKRSIKKAYGDDFDYDLDFGGSQSQGAPCSQGEDPAFNTQQSEDAFSPGQSVRETSRSTKPSQRGKGRLTEEEKAAREAEKERKKQERIAAREAKKQQKEAEKVEKQAQRAQQRLDRQRETGKTAIQDLVVHLDPEFAKHKAGREIMQKLEDTFGESGREGPDVDVGRRLPLHPLKSASWSRAIHEHGGGSQSASQSQPTLQSIDFMLLYFTAEEFVQRVADDKLQSVIQQAALKCPDCTLCFIMDGLEHYLTLRQRREFQANGPGGGGFNRAFVDDFLGGMATLWPGVRHCVVHDTAQAAEHFVGITRALAEQPFRAEVAYVMSFGAGKPDSNAMQELLKRNPLPHKAREVWFKALGCIPRLGPQAALAVSSSHASLGSLIAAYEAQPGSVSQKENMLQGLSKYGGTRIGPAGSRSIFQILTSEDPNLCL